MTNIYAVINWTIAFPWLMVGIFYTLKFLKSEFVLYLVSLKIDVYNQYDT